MNESRVPFKAMALLAPLGAGILALHAWGDAASEGVGRRVDLWQYPEVSRAPFVLRVPRSVGDGGMVADVLNRFPDECVRAYGSLLGLRRPAPGVEVLLLGADAASYRLAGELGRSLHENESAYDPDRRAILVKMERVIEPSRVVGALRRGIARLLLSEAGSARWAPWLAEGLTGLLENSTAADAKAAEELPALDLLLTAPEADFRGHGGAAYSRGARLLVAYLHHTFPAEFAAYCRASREEGAVKLGRFIEGFAANPIGEQAAWRDWLQAQK
jgi:hypothetical protein